MKESNSANKFQMLVKLAFVLFWFSRGLATNETKSLAANQNWNTPHDWPFKKSFVQLTNQVVRKSKSNLLSVEGWEKAFQRCFADVLTEIKLREFSFWSCSKHSQHHLFKRYMVFFTERFLARLFVQSYGRWENRPWNNEDTLWWST